MFSKRTVRLLTAFGLLGSIVLIGIHGVSIGYIVYGEGYDPFGIPVFNPIDHLTSDYSVYCFSNVDGSINTLTTCTPQPDSDRVLLDAEKSGRPFQWTTYNGCEIGLPFRSLVFSYNCCAKVGGFVGTNGPPLCAFPTLRDIEVRWLLLIVDYVFIVMLIAASYTGITRIARTIRNARAHRRREVGLCLHCGYNLSGNISGACPECGTSIDCGHLLGADKGSEAM